jgi:hypothetical protein
MINHDDFERFYSEGLYCDEAPHLLYAGIGAIPRRLYLSSRLMMDIAQGK